MKFNTLIVDDELHGRTTLQQMVTEYCTHLQVVNAVDSSAKARHYLDLYPVDVVFLDVNMPGENGFDLLNSLPNQDFMLVFVTAYQEYALKAIKASALDYLLKPVTPSDLLRTEEKIKASRDIQAQFTQQRISVLKENLQARQQVPLKITLPNLKGFNVVEVDKIVRLEADGNYTTFHFYQAAPLVVSRPIRDFEDMLDAGPFMRVHRSHLVNLNYLEQYQFDHTGYLLLAGGHKVEISRRRLPALVDKLNTFSLDPRRRERSA